MSDSQKLKKWNLFFNDREEYGGEAFPSEQKMEVDGYCGRIYTVVEYSAYNEAVSDVTKMLGQYDKALSRIEKLRAALELYADPKNYEDHGLGPITEADAIQALALDESEGE